MQLEMFGADLGQIYRVLVQSHEKFSGDLTLEGLRAIYLDGTVFSKAQRMAINQLFDAISLEEDVSDDVAKHIFFSLVRKERARKGAEMLVEVMDGKSTDFSTIVDYLGGFKEDSLIKEYPVISDDVEALLRLSSPENLLKFYIPSLTERVYGAGPGHNIIIFGRPESGKSSFVANNNIGYLLQGAVVHYFGNEEPGWKIMLNHLRAATSLSDRELHENFKNGVKSYDAWNKIKGNFKLHDSVGMSVTELNAYAEKYKPDVMVVDQTDKISIEGTYEAGHARLKELYVKTREIAKRHDLLFVSVSQASADAEECRELTYSMLDGSKTGKAGEADIIIGIGRNSATNEDHMRYLTVSKNKVSGWHGMIPCIFQPAQNLWQPYAE